MRGIPNGQCPLFRGSSSDVLLYAEHHWSEHYKPPSFLKRILFHFDANNVSNAPTAITSLTLFVIYFLRPYPTSPALPRALDSPSSGVFWKESHATPPGGAQDSAHLQHKLLSSKPLVAIILTRGKREIDTTDEAKYHYNMLQ